MIHLLRLVKSLRFSILNLCLFTVIVAVVAGWHVDRNRLQQRTSQIQYELKLLSEERDTLQSAMEGQHYSELRSTVNNASIIKRLHDNNQQNQLRVALLEYVSREFLYCLLR